MATQLEQVLSTEQINQIQAGIDKYIRLQGFIYSDNPMDHKWLSDEEDLVSGLRTVADVIKRSESMIGKSKHVGVPYMVSRECARDVHALLFFGETDSEVAGKNKRFLPMYHLVLLPILSVFDDQYGHRRAIDNIDAIVQDVTRRVMTSSNYGSLDDALVARVQVNKMVQEHERHQQEVSSKKRKRSGKRAEREAFVELLQEVIAEEMLG